MTDLMQEAKAWSVLDHDRHETTSVLLACGDALVRVSGPCTVADLLEIVEMNAP